MLVVVAYDVLENRRRTKLAQALEAYGRRVQLSVFEALLDPSQIEELLERIEALIDPEEDKVRLYRICAACERRIEILGLGARTEEREVYIL